MKQYKLWKQKMHEQRMKEASKEAKMRKERAKFVGNQYTKTSIGC